MKTLIASVSAAALLSGAGLAQDEPMRQLGAHVHGEARLSVAVDPASGLALAELAGAAWNFYGFERAPETDEERDIIAAVNAALSEPDLIAFPDRAGCALAEARVEGAGGDHDHGHADHEAHASEHDHDHGHEDHEDHASEHDHAHDEHGHDHGDHDHAEHAHTDLAVSWTYQCERAEAASRFDAAGVFTALPRLESVEAEAFDGTRAAVRTLTPDDAVITLD